MKGLLHLGLAMFGCRVNGYVEAMVTSTNVVTGLPHVQDIINISLVIGKEEGMDGFGFPGIGQGGSLKFGKYSLA
jgi:hypothetical protein